MKPKVAVVTLYYNRRDHVVDSINSLLSQTYDNLEIIIVDDCSKDDTFEIIQKTVGNSSKAKYLRNEHNKGFTQTLIDTINNIDAEYVAIHGAGDISLPTRIEEQVNHLQNNTDVGVVTTDITNIKRPKFHKTEITLDDLIKKNQLTHGAVMFRRECYNEVGGYRAFFTTRQDKDLWFRMSLITKIHFLNKKLYTLVEIKKSVSQTASKNELSSLLSIYPSQLIKERKKDGFDSLDKYGPQAALMFKTSKTTRLFLVLIAVDLRNRKFSNALQNFKHLMKYSNLIFFIAFFVLLLILIIIYYVRFT